MRTFVELTAPEVADLSPDGVAVLPIGAMRLLVTVGNLLLTGWVCLLSCRLVGELYVMTLDVDAATEPDLGDLGARLGVTLHVRPADEDVL